MNLNDATRTPTRISLSLWPLAVLGVAFCLTSSVRADFTLGSLNAGAEYPAWSASSPGTPGAPAVTAPFSTELGFEENDNQVPSPTTRPIANNRIMAQTFVVFEPTSLESIFVGYQWIQNNSQQITFRLLEVPSRGIPYHVNNEEQENVKVIGGPYSVSFGAEPSPDPENNPDRLYALRLDWTGDPLILLPRHTLPGSTGSEAYAIEFRATSNANSSPAATIRYLTNKYDWGRYMEQTPAGVHTGFGGGNEHTVAVTGTPVDLGLQGDFNDDGVVNALDYVIWRMEGELHNDWTPGWQEQDYDYWQFNYGAPGDESEGSTMAVPEPTFLTMLGAVVVSPLLIRRRRRL